MGHIRDEDVALDNLGDGRTSLLQDGLEVLAALLGLVGDGALNQGALSSEGNLAGAVDGRGGLDGLGLHGEGFVSIRASAGCIFYFPRLPLTGQDSRKGRQLIS